MSHKTPKGAIAAIAIAGLALTACGSGSKDDADADGSDPQAEQTIAYARALWDIEQERQTAYQSLVSEISSDKLPELACDRPRSLRVLSGDAREIVVNFCNTAREIVERTRLTPDEFNQISQDLATDTDLQAAIEAELLRIRDGEPQPPEEES
ncbi:MAG: DUF4168 domain-containing protein [Geitlerinemataceae cyanobacterium]